jgi:hypothetical protein
MFVKYYINVNFNEKQNTRKEKPINESGLV